MMDFDNLKYICTNLGNLAAIPVRLYDKEKEILYYSIVDLLKDPFDIDKEEAFQLKDDVCYFESSFGYYYGILNFEGRKIVLGPTGQLHLSTQDLKSLSFDFGIPPSSTDVFIAQMSSITAFPLMSLLQIMCMVYFSLTGEKKSLENIAIHEAEQELIQEEVEKEDVQRTVDDLEGEGRPYNALDIENRLMDMVMRGDVGAIDEFMRNAPAVRGGTMANEQLRQLKNTFIVTVTLVSRAAIRGGMDVTQALSLSDSYIQKCEFANSGDKIMELSYRVVRDYAERVAKLKLGQNPSVLVVKVSNYVQSHLSEAIKVEEIAKALYMGRSRLSTNFKAETGINISDYVTQLKIDEAKRLLRYSNKSFTAIALYLGFSSQSHFSQVFRKYTGTTPSEYRQLHKHY